MFAKATSAELWRVKKSLLRLTRASPRHRTQSPMSAASLANQRTACASGGARAFCLGQSCSFLVQRHARAVVRLEPKLEARVTPGILEVCQRDENNVATVGFFLVELHSCTVWPKN